MKTVIVFCVLLVSSGCSSPRPQNCGVTKSAGVATISCPNSTATVSDGSDGIGIVSATMPATTAQCPNGGVVVIFAQDTTATGVLSTGDADLESAVVCNGSDGKTGASGPQGPQGVAGSSCTTTVVNPGVMAPQGGATISCQDGTTALILNGTPGQRGAEGSPGVVVTPIQFCPGSNSYPNVFNEIGFCIDGNIYAVYSQNGGFLTEVVPGDYSSDGINSGCNFTVASNCVVTH